MITQLELKSWLVREGVARFKETATDIVYDAQPMETGIMVRPAGDGPFSNQIEFISMENFCERFDELWG